MLAILMALLLATHSALAGPPPWPEGLKPLLDGASREEVLAAFMGIPYRSDGVVSDDGLWTTWNKPGQTLRSPGFNCSGYLLEAVRHLSGLDISLAQAALDRDGDSGLLSEMGPDWDYGLDIILNLSGANLDGLLPTAPAGTDQLQETPPRKYLANEAGRPEGMGLDINGPGFPELLSSLEPDSIYLLAISKPDRRFKGGLSYYHVGLIHADDQGNIWIYQCTARAGVHRLNLNNPQGIATIRRYFPPIKSAQRRIVLAKFHPDRLLLTKAGAPPRSSAQAQIPPADAGPEVAVTGQEANPRRSQPGKTTLSRSKGQTTTAADNPPAGTAVTHAGDKYPPKAKPAATAARITTAAGQADEPATSANDPASQDGAPAAAGQADEPATSANVPASQGGAPAAAGQADEPATSANVPASKDEAPVATGQADEPATSANDPASKDGASAAAGQAEEPPTSANDPASKDGASAAAGQAEEPAKAATGEDLQPDNRPEIAKAIEARLSLEGDEGSASQALDHQNPFVLNVVEDDQLERPIWLDSSEDPWTAAARLDSQAHRYADIEGDGLGGEVEVQFDFVPFDIMAQEQTVSADVLDNAGGKPTESAQGGPPSGPSVTEKLDVPKTSPGGGPGKLLPIPGDSSPLAGTLGNEPISVSKISQVATDRPADSSQHDGKPQARRQKGAASEETAQATDSAKLPQGEEIGNGIKVFTLFQ
ncbi:MAG: hypothetical protein LBP92_00935 [Deltaproteobacteria bacterium]|nr:hypothetical protein [Deltaproteobacteria bacterium]